MVIDLVEAGELAVIVRSDGAADGNVGNRRPRSHIYSQSRNVHLDLNLIGAFTNVKEAEGHVLEAHVTHLGVGSDRLEDSHKGITLHHTALLHGKVADGIAVTLKYPVEVTHRKLCTAAINVCGEIYVSARESSLELIKGVDQLPLTLNILHVYGNIQIGIAAGMSVVKVPLNEALLIGVEAYTGVARAVSGISEPILEFAACRHVVLAERNGAVRIGVIQGVGKLYRLLPACVQDEGLGIKGITEIPLFPGLTLGTRIPAGEVIAASAYGIVGQGLGSNNIRTGMIREINVGIRTGGSVIERTSVDLEGNDVLTLKIATVAAAPRHNKRQGEGEDRGKDQFLFSHLILPFYLRRRLLVREFPRWRPHPTFLRSVFSGSEPPPRRHPLQQPVKPQR